MSEPGAQTPEGEPEAGEKIPLVEPQSSRESSDEDVVILEDEVIAANERMKELSLELGQALGNVETLFKRSKDELTSRRTMSWELVGEDEGWVLHAEVAFHMRRKPKT